MANLDELFDTVDQGSIAPPPPITPPDISLTEIGRDPLYDVEEPTGIGKEKAHRNLNIAKTLNLNPQNEASLVKKARDTGQSLNFLREAEKITTAPDIPSDIPPGVLQHLSQSPSHSSVSGNDIPGLSKLEEVTKQTATITESELSFWDRFTHNLSAGTKDVIKNTTGSIRAFADFFAEMDKRVLSSMPEESRQAEIERRKNLSPVAQAFMIDPEELVKISEKAKEIQESEALEVTELMKRPGIAGYFDDVVRMGPQILFQVVAQATTGPIGSAAFMASQIGGGKFTQLEAEGVDTIRAFQASLADAALQAPLETIGISRALKLWKPGKTLGKVFRDVLGAMGTEFITEWFQKYPEAATEIWARAQENNLSTSDQVDLFFKNFADITVAGMYEGLVAAPFGGLTSAVSIGAQIHRDSSWVERQQKINDAVNETETKTLSPEITKDFLDIVGLGEEVFMSAEGVKVLFQDATIGEAEDILGRLGVDTNEAREALTRGQDITFKESVLHSALSPEEFALIKDHIKAAPGATTASERESDLAVENINRLDSVFKEAQANQQAFDAEAERIKQQVVDTGHTQEFADTYIDTVQRFANRIALEGRDRVAFLEGINIQVKSRAESEGGRVFEQEPIGRPRDIELYQEGFELEQAAPPDGEIPSPEITLDGNSFTNKQWQTVATELINRGFDIRGADDAKELSTRFGSDLLNTHPDWKAAGLLATGRKVEVKKHVGISNISFDRVKELGFTNDVREAGYLTPEGRYIDLSGKKEGGTPKVRSLDHREVGGTKGMLEFMNLGNIRLLPEGDGIDIFQPPTEKQEAELREWIRLHSGSVFVDIQEGLGELIDKGEEGFRFELTRRTSLEYQIGTKETKVINDIRKFYRGEDVGELGKSFFQEDKPIKPTKEPPRGKVNIDSDGYLISLFQTRNLSTLLHETGHIFFEEMVGMVDAGQASEQLTKDVETIRKWLELEPGQEFTDEHHEKFARGFEAYLLEGKAPTVELSTAFARFKRWLSQVYKSVKELNVKLNADIRKVFDRMLISDAEIENVAGLNSIVIDQEKMDELGVVTEDQAFMRRLINTAQEKGKDGLQKDRNRGYRSNIKKWRKEATEEVDGRKEYQDVADIVETGGMNREEYIFDYGVEETLRITPQEADTVPAGDLFIGDTFKIDGIDNKVVDEDEDGNIIIEDDQGVQIQLDPFDQIPIDGGTAGISAVAAETNKLPHRRLLKSGARPIGVVAMGHGYDSANQMIEIFHNMLPRRLAIQQGVNERQAEFDAQFLAEDYLMGTKEFAEYLTILSKYLEGSPVVEAGRDVPTGKKSTKTISRQRFKAFAVETINQMSVRDARRTDRFMSAYNKAMNEMRKALFSGDFGKASRANERARLNYEMAGESIRIRKETDKLLRRSNRVVTAKLDNDYKQQVLKLLRRFGLTDRKFRIDEDALATEIFFLRLEKNADADLFRSVPVFEPFLMADGLVNDYRDLSVTEIRRVDEMLGYLVKTGRDVLNKTLSDGKTMIEDKAIELSKWILDHRKKDKKVISEEKRRRRKFSDFTRQYFAHSDELIFIMRSLDGFVSVKGQVGPNEAFWNDQLKEREESDQLLVKRITEEIKPALAQLSKSAKKFPNKIDIEGVGIPAEMRKHGRVWNFHKILAVGLNMGNTVNRQRIQTGYNIPFTGKNQEGNPVEFFIPLTEIDLNRITRSLTKQDWQAIQTIWDTIDTMWPAQDRVFFALNGFHRPKVKADPFTVTAINEETGQSETVNLKGGYYHIEYDPELTDRVEEWTEKDDLINDTDALFPATSAKSGQMVERVKTTHMPVKLSLSVLYKHISIASRYIHYAELLSDLSQVLRHPTYQNTIDQKAGKFVRKQLRPILANIARPNDNMLDFIDNWIEREVGRSTINILGSTLDVPVKQAFSLPAFFAEVGNQNTAKGLAIYINGILGENGVIWHPFEARKAMHEMEPFMAQRSKSFDREMQTVFKKIDVDPKNLGGFSVNDVGAAFMSLIRAVDFATVYPAWWGAYQEGLTRFDGDSIEARKFATRTIRFTQPSALPIDKNHFQRSKKGWHRLATMFSSFAFKHGQNVRFDWNAWNNRDADGKRTLSSAKYFTDIMTVFIAPPLMMSLLFTMLRGEEIDLEDLLIDIASYQFMGLFMVREMTSWLAFALKSGTRHGRDPFSSAAFEGGRIASNMFLNIAELVGDLGDEKKRDAALLSFAAMIGYAYKAPVDKVTKRVVKGWKQFDREGGTPTKILFPSHKR